MRFPTTCFCHSKTEFEPGKVRFSASRALEHVAAVNLLDPFFKDNALSRLATRRLSDWHGDDSPELFMQQKDSSNLHNSDNKISRQSVLPLDSLCRQSKVRTEIIGISIWPLHRFLWRFICWRKLCIATWTWYCMALQCDSCSSQAIVPTVETRLLASSLAISTAEWVLGNT